MDDYRMNENEEKNEYGYYDESRPENTKRKRRGLKITAIVLAAVLFVTGIGYAGYRAVNAISAARQKSVERTADIVVPDDNAAEAEVKTASASVENAAVQGTSSVMLTKKGSIGETDTDAKTVVLDVSEVVENVMPCVVAITDNLELTSSNSYNPYNYFFGGSRSGDSAKQETVASGSGVIIAEDDSKLLIVTNNHVVDNEGNYSYYTVSSTGLTVQFVDGSTATATVKGTDSEADLAVISVDIDDLSADTKEAIRIAVVGNSDEIKVGAGVIAIGNAMGYGQSVTTGIVSAKEREVTIDGITRTLMQTDAAINPGNSGGGLFNAKGELIGINSAKSVDTSVEGMGFAIPITSASSIIEGLMNMESIAEEDQGYLGINGETVPSSYISQYGYPKGVSVTRIAEDSPAEKAGLQIYDIITAVNGRAVESMNSLKSIVNNYPAGTTITLSVSRPDGRGFKEIEVEATLARLSDLNGMTQQTTPEDGRKDEDERPELPSQGDEGEYPFSDEDSDIDSFFDWLFEKLK